jgi:translation initiation factor 3 subunit M
MPGLLKLSQVEGSFDELATELATYLDGAKGEDSTVANDVTALLADSEKPEGPKETDRDAVLKKLVIASSVLNNAPERELQAAYNLLLHLISQVEEPGRYLQPICRYLTQPITSSPHNGTGIALGIFASVFNTIQPDDETRYHVLLAIIDVIKNSNNFDTLQPQLKNVDSWVEEWELESEEAQKLYLAISSAASAARESDESYIYLLKALRTTQEEPTSASSREISIRALKLALQSDKHFDFQDLIALDSVQALRKSDQTWSELLELFSSETFEDLQEFKESNSGFLSSNDLSEAVLDRKMRLLTLASLGAQEAKSRTLSYASIAKALQVPLEDVESWVIDSIRSGLVEGKLSQQKQEFLIHRSTYRVFGENQWREVASRLETWKSSLTSVLAVIRAQKAEFAADKEAALNGTNNNDNSNSHWGNRDGQRHEGGRGGNYRGDRRQRGGYNQGGEQREPREQRDQRKEVQFAGAGDD